MKTIINNILAITNDELDKFTFTDFNKMVEHSDQLQFINAPSGTSHYKLLAFVSTLFSNQLLYDIGTNSGRSAIALSHNPCNLIKSYDIIQLLPVNYYKKNIEYIIGDCTTDKNILTAPVILLDTAHDGTFENIFYSFLLENKYKGLLFLDDIHLNDPMKNFWNKITQEKYDLTSKGAWSGTGLVVFD